MNRLSLLSGMVLLCWGLQAQSITQSANEPAVGDVDKNYSIDTSNYATGLPVNVTGTNCNWDYSKLFGAYPIVTDSFLSPSVVPASVNYPGCTVVQRRTGLNNFFQSVTSPAATQLLGSTSPTLTLSFTNTAIIAEYPVNYGYAKSDAVSGTYTLISINGPCNGTIDVSCDGVGTLLFPNNITFTNVVRLKSVETLTLTQGIFPLGLFKQTVYNHYAPGKKFPILSINYTLYQPFAGTPVITTKVLGNFNYFTVGIPELHDSELSLKIIPNPVENTLHVSTDALLVKVTINSLDGREVMHAESSEMDVSQLMPGIYLATIHSGSQMRMLKFVKN